MLLLHWSIVLAITVWWYEPELLKRAGRWTITVELLAFSLFTLPFLLVSLESARESILDLGTLGLEFPSAGDLLFLWVMWFFVVVLSIYDFRFTFLAVVIFILALAYIPALELVVAFGIESLSIN